MGELAYKWARVAGRITAPVAFGAWVRDPFAALWLFAMIWLVDDWKRQE